MTVKEDGRRTSLDELNVSAPFSRPLFHVGIIPILVAGMQEQQGTIKVQKQQIQEMNAQLMVSMQEQQEIIDSQKQRIQELDARLEALESINNR